MNKCIDSYTDVGFAHAKLLLVKLLRKEHPPRNKHFFLSVCYLIYSVLPPLRHNKARISCMQGKWACRGNRVSHWPP